MSLFDEEAEISLLGTMLHENAVADLARAIVTEHDFATPERSKLYAAFQRMRSAGERFTVATVPVGCEEAAKRSDMVPSAVHAKTYALRVSRAAKLRRLHDTAMDLARDCEKTEVASESDTEHFFQDWQERLVNATTIARRQASSRMADVCKEVGQQIEANMRNPGAMRGAPTGIASFDELLRGMRPSDTHIIAARAGMGKTALMLNVLRGAAASGARTLVYSYEMKPAMLVQRMLTAAARVSGTRIDAGAIGEADQIRISNAWGTLAPLPIWFEERGTVRDIRATAVEQHRTQGLDLLVVDHVGLVDAIGRQPSREREVAEISRGLKALARSLNIPVLILAQLNRNADPTQEPALSDLRESGSLEQDASVVIMLWATPDDEKQNLLQWKLAKNRHGPAGRKGVMTFARDTQRIEERQQHSYTPPPRPSLTDEAAKLATWKRL